MVRFESADEQAAKAGEKRPENDLAPVTYLPGAAPGMKRRSPLDSRSSGVSELRPAAAEVLGTTRWADADADVDVQSDAGADGGVDEDGDTDDARSDRAEKVLVHRLRGRSLSADEARAVLRESDLDEDEAEEIIDRFTRLHYIDEARLAEQIVRSHHERKGLGRTAIEAELRRRKVLPEVIAAALEELPDDEEERATELAVKRVQQLDRYDEQTIDRRLTGFLMRKGYSSSVVRAAVKAALASRGRASSTVRFR